jgi:hypothetical protein
LPKDLADRELDIVKRAQKRPVKEGTDGYINEVDLGNGHTWKEKLDGTWCRFSNGATNCTRLILTVGAQPPGTVVARALKKSALRDVYFEWAADRATDNVEVALAFDPDTETYAVVVGELGHVRYPDEGERWITIAHTHPGGPSQPGVINPSPKDLSVILRGAGRDTTRVRKWVHSQTPEGEWREVEYGMDLEAQKYYVQPTGGDPIYFDELSDPELKQKLMERGLTLSAFYDLNEEMQIKHIGELSRTEFYASWWAEQFVWND